MNQEQLFQIFVESSSLLTVDSHTLPGNLARLMLREKVITPLFA
jgi:hypothetical protein